METLEYDDALKILYKSVKSKPFFVDVPKMNYIIYEGTGHPSGDIFQDACNTLFTLSYIIKFKVVRKEKNTDYKVNPLEVSWHLDKSGNVTAFDWKAMIMQPCIVTKEDFTKTAAIAKELGKEIDFKRVYFETLHFGQCVQCAHRGDYNDMNSTMYKMQDFAKENGFEYDLYTHDIYLNDSRKTKTENLKSIMRIGVRKGKIKL